VERGRAGPADRDDGGQPRDLTEDAEVVVVALGSVLGTVKDTVDELRAGPSAENILRDLGITASRIG